MASKGRPAGSIPLFFLQVPEQLVKDFPFETLEFEPWVEDLLQDQPGHNKRRNKGKSSQKFYWRTLSGEIVQMDKMHAKRYHKDWILIE